MRKLIQSNYFENERDSVNLMKRSEKLIGEIGVIVGKRRENKIIKKIKQKLIIISNELKSQEKLGKAKLYCSRH